MTVKEMIEAVKNEIAELEETVRKTYLTSSDDYEQKIQYFNECIYDAQLKLNGLDLLTRDLDKESNISDPNFVENRVRFFILEKEREKLSLNRKIRSAGFSKAHEERFLFICRLYNATLVNDGDFKEIVPLLEYIKTYIANKDAKLSSQVDEMIAFTKDPYLYVSDDKKMKISNGVSNLYLKYLREFAETLPYGFAGTFPYSKTASGTSFIYKFNNIPKDLVIESKSTDDYFTDISASEKKCISDSLNFLLEIKSICADRFECIKKVETLDADIAALQSLTKKQREEFVRERYGLFEFPNLSSTSKLSDVKDIMAFIAEREEIEDYESKLSQMLQNSTYTAYLGFLETAADKGFKKEGGHVDLRENIGRLNYISNMDLDTTFNNDLDAAVTLEEEQVLRDFAVIADGTPIQGLEDLYFDDDTTYRTLDGAIEAARIAYEDAKSDYETALTEKNNYAAEREKVLYVKKKGRNGKNKYAKFKWLFRKFNKKKYLDNLSEFDSTLAQKDVEVTNAQNNVEEAKKPYLTLTEFRQKFTQHISEGGFAYIYRLLSQEKQKIMGFYSNADDIKFFDDLLNQYDVIGQKRTTFNEAIDNKIAEWETSGEYRYQEIELLRFIKEHSYYDGGLRIDKSISSYAELLKRYGEGVADEIYEGHLTDAQSATKRG